MKYAIEQLRHSVLGGKKYGFNEAIEALESLSKTEVSIHVLEFLNERLNSVTDGLNAWMNIGSEEHKRQLKRQKDLKEAIDFLSDVNYLTAKADVATDLYHEGKITRPECLRHEVDLLVGKDSGAINL